MEFLEVNLRVSPRLKQPGVFPLTPVHTQLPAIHQNYHDVFLPVYDSSRSAPGMYTSAVTPCIGFSPQFWNGSLSFDLCSLRSPRKVIDFGFVQFFCCKDESDIFQALYMSELKPEFMFLFSFSSKDFLKSL